MSWTYDLALTSEKDRLRLLVGDTDSSDPLMQDEELTYFISYTGSVEGAAATVCQSLASRFARQADKQVGDLRISYSQRADRYQKLAEVFSKRAQILAAPSAGGVFTTDKEAWDARDDVVKTAIRLGIHDIT